MNSTVSVVAGRQRRNRWWLPLLTFLFVIAWGLLTALVVLQDRTIDAQADIIHGLLKENQTLRQTPATPKPHAQSSVRPKAPSSQSSVGPKVAAPAEHLQKDAAQIPSSQKTPQSSTKADRKRHNAGKKSPFRPPAEMTDPSDTRRTVFSI